MKKVLLAIAVVFLACACGETTTDTPAPSSTPPPAVVLPAPLAFGQKYVWPNKDEITIDNVKHVTNSLTFDVTYHNNSDKSVDINSIDIVVIGDGKALVSSINPDNSVPAGQIFTYRQAYDARNLTPNSVVQIKVSGDETRPQITYQGSVA